MKIERAILLVAWLPIAACAAGDDMMEEPQAVESGSVTKEPDDRADTGDDDAEPPTFAAVYALIGMNCGGGKAGCHVSGTAGGLEMPDANTAYEHLVDVDVASKNCPGEIRVVTGDADASQLVQVLEGTSACIKPMPLGRDPMSTANIALVRAWIEAGAAPD
jgi:hypothetical protein